MQLHVSSGADESQLQKETMALLDRKWTLDEDCMGVKKTFIFPTYAKALVHINSPFTAA